VPKPTIVGIRRPTAIALLIVILGSAASTYAQVQATQSLARLTSEQAASTGEIVSDGVDCILAQLGEHRINSSSFNQSAAEYTGFTYERNVDLAVPEEADVLAIQAACGRFLPTSNAGARESTTGGG